MIKIVPLVCSLAILFSSESSVQTQNLYSDKKQVISVTQENSFDYFITSATVPKELPTVKPSLLRQELKRFGSFIGNRGMNTAAYKKVMTHPWNDVTVSRETGEYEEKPLTFDLKEIYTYEQIQQVILDLSTYQGVEVFVIGQSQNELPIYGIEIDMPSDEEKEVIMLTGGIHTRETAGSRFILKQLIELIEKRDTKAVSALLKKVKFVAVPYVNPDAVYMMGPAVKRYTYSDGILWKAYVNGTDGNRNFPGLQWGQIAKYNKKSSFIGTSPTKLYYAGDSAGSCPETKAMMRFIYHYVAVEHARYYIDYHQQGRIIYAGKPWQTKAQEGRCRDLAKFALQMLNKGNSSRYSYVAEEPSYGLGGQGSTLTDFAVSVAVGAKYSPYYGFYVFTDGIDEYPLIQVKDLDATKLPLLPEINPEFATMTFEIGYGKSYLGGNRKTMQLQAEEYTKYHYDEFLLKLGKRAIDAAN